MLTVHVQCHGSSQKILPTSGRTALEANGASTAPIFFNEIQVDVPTTHEQHSMPQTNRFGPNVTVQPHGKLHELILDFIVSDHDIEAAQKNEYVLPYSMNFVYES